MNLKKLVDVLEVETITGNLDKEVSGIAYDSREVEAGHLFVAISGFEMDGHDFIKEAVEAGAEAVLVEKEVELASDIPAVKVADTRHALAKVSAKFYDYPARDLTVIGVTGTNGKTTTTYLIETILRELGIETGLIGTIKNKVGTQEADASRTTPESLDLQRYFARMREEGITHVVMEVSSHALALDRVLEIDFDRQVFTNLSQDHLDFHESWEDYFAAKLKLFQFNEQPSIVNIDNKWGPEIINRAAGEMVTYGVESRADFTADEIKIDARGVSYQLQMETEELAINLKLTGRFNVYNSLAAVAAVASLGYELGDIKAGLETAERVPGRFQLVEAGQEFGVIIDYAHTPDGMENVLETAHEFTSGRVIVLFGCGGDRDRKKRPIMGQLGIELADLAVVTSDNPRSEEPAAIIEEIVAGIEEVDGQQGADYLVIQERGAAIEEAVKLADPEDIILIIGKGHETYQDFGDRVIDFDDREVARQAIQAGSES